MARLLAQGGPHGSPGMADLGPKVDQVDGSVVKSNEDNYLLVGKAATAIYIATAVVFMYFNYLRESSVLIDAMVWLSLSVTLVSGGDYVLKMRRLINEGH